MKLTENQPTSELRNNSVHKGRSSPKSLSNNPQSVTENILLFSRSNRAALDVAIKLLNAALNSN
jgi:hypothetical protein